MTYEEFVADRQRPLLRFAMVLAGDGRQAEELVQAVLVRAYERWDRIAGVTDPAAYVRKMVLNEFLSWRRRGARVVPLDPHRHDVGQSDTADEQAERSALAAELARLPRRQRVVIVLRYYEDHTDNEIAELLGCSPGTVRGYASRALARLRVQLPAPQPHLEKS